MPIYTSNFRIEANKKQSLILLSNELGCDIRSLFTQLVDVLVDIALCLQKEGSDEASVKHFCALLNTLFRRGTWQTNSKCLLGTEATSAIVQTRS